MIIYYIKSIFAQIDTAQNVFAFKSWWHNNNYDNSRATVVFWLNFNNKHEYFMILYYTMSCRVMRILDVWYEK